MDGGCYDKLSRLLPQFAELGKFDIEKFHAKSKNPKDIKELFDSKKAVYHHSCVSRFNQQKLDRALAQSSKSVEHETEDLGKIPVKWSRRSEPSTKMFLACFVWGQIVQTTFVLQEQCTPHLTL